MSGNKIVYFKNLLDIRKKDNNSDNLKSINLNFHMKYMYFPKTYLSQSRIEKKNANMNKSFPLNIWKLSLKTFSQS